MKCISCGKEIPAGNVYCPICGKEAQIISDKSVLEEDLLKILMEDDSAPREDYNSEAAMEARKERERQLQKKKKLELQRKKKKKRILIVLIVVIICVVAVGIFFGLRKSNSFDSLYEKAEIAYHTGKYEEAVELTVKALDKEPDSIDGYLLLGDIYVQLEDYEKAEKCYMKVIDIDLSNYDAHEKLLKMYSQNGDYEAIQALSSTIPEDVNLQKLFDTYLVSMPVINVPGGEYSEPVKIELTAKRGLKIYYTVDGTAPSAGSTLYEKMFELNEEGTITLQAICVDEKGNASEILTERYVLEFEAPDKPRVTPDGGEFDELTEVKITAQSGTTVYYTWDGTTPNTNSSVYTKPIEIPEGNNILSVIAVDNDTKKESEVFKTNFIYYPTIETETPSVE